jgi:hypothetical protein
MKYYLILLLYGRVVEINSFDEEEARDRQVERLRQQMHGCSEYDEIQTLNEVK